MLSSIGLGYMAASAARRLANPAIQAYTFQRALHAARDRFTPRYAHRQSVEEVLRWFEEAGFGENTAVDWRAIPPSQQDNYRRNVGVWGDKIKPAPPAVGRAAPAKVTSAGL